MSDRFKRRRRRRGWSRSWRRNNQCHKWGKKRNEEKQVSQGRNDQAKGKFWRILVDYHKSKGSIGRSQSDRRNSQNSVERK